VTSIPAQNRPFGTAVVNGFDFDFESSVSNMPAFANELRTLMNAAGGTYYLSAAPQCPYPDAADGPMLAGAVSFDFIWVQFYNNYCEISSYVNGAATQNNFNFATWDNWAKTVSLNPNVKVFLGIPGQAGAGLAGYENGTPLQEVIAYSKGFSTFAGVMIWDMSLAYANTGFLNQVISDVGAPAVTQPTTTAVSSKSTSSSKTATTFSTVTTATGPTTTGTVGAYDQCGGTGYTGSTACIAGYTCTEISAYWSQCDPSP
jgi:chitinase